MWMGDHLQTEGVVSIFYFLYFLFSHYHSFSLVSNLDARLQLMWIGRVIVLYMGHFTLHAFSALVSFGSDVNDPAS